MNKEEILEKSRKSKEDEGFTNAENKGRSAGTVVFVLLCAIALIVNLIKGQPIYLIAALIFGYMATEAYPKYKFT